LSEKITDIINTVMTFGEYEKVDLKQSFRYGSIISSHCRIHVMTSDDILCGESIRVLFLHEQE
jgi:hypothetical protein